MKRRAFFYFFIHLSVFLSFFAEARAQALSVTPLGTQSPSTLVQNLLGLGVSFSNVTYSGTAWSSGTFTGGSGIVGFGSGIVLSNGDAASVAGPNGTSASTCNSNSGDQDLANLAGVPLASTYDATVLSFDFVPAFNNITFQYVFSSDEYNAYVGSTFNDTFGFFVNGVNAALIPGTSTAVAINNVNACVNPSYFINNTTQTTTLGSCTQTLPSAGLNTSMNGLTTVLTVNAAVTPGVTNHIKLAICDLGDCVLDSNVFIRANSFSSGPTATPTNTPTITDTFTPTHTPTLTPTFTPSFTPTLTATKTPTKTPTNTATPTATYTPCGYPGNTCTPTATPTPTNTPYTADIFTVTKNVLRSGESVSIFVNYTTYPGQYDLCIYNSAGEHVKTLDSQVLSAPVSQWYSWDGKNKYGDPCASGVYLFYLIEPYSAKTKRILLVR